MKKLSFIIFAIFILSFASFSQTKSVKKSVKPKAKITKKKVVAKKRKPIFKREKFDPKRNAELDVKNAIAKATKEKKRIILDVGGEWCGWCIHMDEFLEKNSELKKLRVENYIWVKVNFSEENENEAVLSKYPHIIGFPHLFVLDSDGTLLFSQDTSELESGNTYNYDKFMDFLLKWKLQ